jgi:hypothetical protein
VKAWREVQTLLSAKRELPYIGWRIRCLSTFAPAAAALAGTLRYGNHRLKILSGKIVSRIVPTIGRTP